MLLHGGQARNAALLLARMERLACDDVVAVCAIIFPNGCSVGSHAFNMCAGKYLSSCNVHV